MFRILIADGNDACRANHQHFFTSQGHAVEVAAGGLDCLAKLRQSIPDVVLLDLKIPWGGADGVLAAMRESPGLAAIPVVLTSAPPAPEAQAELVTAPVVNALAQPLSLMVLFESVRAAVAKNRLFSETSGSPFHTSEN